MTVFHSALASASERVGLSCSKYFPPPPEAPGAVGLAVATRVPGAAPASAWVCVVQADGAAAAVVLGALSGAGAGVGAGALEEPLTDPHQRERRLPLGGGAAGASPCVVVHELGFAACVLRGAGAGGSGASCEAEATVLVRPFSVRTSVAKAEMEPASAPAPPLLAMSLSTSPLLPPLRAEASSASACVLRPAAWYARLRLTRATVCSEDDSPSHIAAPRSAMARVC